MLESFNLWAINPGRGKHMITITENMQIDGYNFVCSVLEHDPEFTRLPKEIQIDVISEIRNDIIRDLRNWSAMKGPE